MSSLDSLSETIFQSDHCMVMHSDAMVFLFDKTIADWLNFCKRQTGLLNFSPQLRFHLSKPEGVYAKKMRNWPYVVNSTLINSSHCRYFFSWFSCPPLAF